MSGTVQTIFSLYELSMAIGKSLNYKANCDHFMKVFLSRKMLKAGWIVQIQNKNVRLRYAIPAPYKPKEEVTIKYIQEFLDQDKPVCVAVDEQISNVCPVPVSGGYIIAFPMANQSVLFVHSPKKEAWADAELRQLDPVIRKFGMSLLASSDFEEQKRLLKRLERNNKDLNDYAHVVSHDLKSPLRNIHSLVQWIQEDLEGDQPDQAVVHMPHIYSSLEKMDGLIAGILRYSKLRETSQANAARVNLNELIDEVLTLVQRQDAIKIEVAPLPEIRADRLRMSQLFQNLIDNALAAMRSTGDRIEIGYKDLGNFYEFHVKDNGPGIAMAHQEKVFQVFQKLDADSTKSGIGLAIVSRIVEDHGGQLRLESEEGQGAAFYFTHPK
ncbi:sensor histidine kinase [Gilvibacter sediminis]|uniref:sensor histidine kinase n=1 Tax=Gilvibacter sediminis TaxID=379071 RepID=UPI002350366D|nr:HAMP domain-containing sensor histidine kinase [Gilvibacter sediminis]MDC7997294.1 HAMP domain-containing sensor histidine kinase [Gilvibacter sediminis]